MSATGALVIALSALVLLGAFAAWLINIPLWAIGAGVVGGAVLVRRLFLRLARSRARQDTEASL